MYVCMYVPPDDLLAVAEVVLFKALHYCCRNARGGRGYHIKSTSVLIVPFRRLKKERFWYLLGCSALKGPQQEH